MVEIEKKHYADNCEVETERLLKHFHELVFSVNPVSDVSADDFGDRKAQEIVGALLEVRKALAMASKGDFSYSIASRGYLSATLKAIQANLNHVGWIIRRIAEGDMQQKVNFVGEFSEAFNLMTEQLSSLLKKLREEEERWKLAMMCSRDAVWEIKLETGEPPYYSPRFFELLGINPGEVPHVIDWAKFFHPDDHALLTIYRRFVTWNNPPYSFELDHRLRCAGGDYRWFMTRGMVLFDTNSGTPLRVVGVMADIQERKEREEHFSYQATHDVLTDLPNRVLFDEHLKNGIAVAKRAGSYVAVVMVDLDSFKLINDTLGHYAGDQVLVEIAGRLQKSLRGSDMASRFGGDEFLMVLAFGKNEWQAITKVLRRTMLALREPIFVNGKAFSITASFGISVYPDDGSTPKILLMRADEAMYRAKQMGRNACVFWKRDKQFDVIKFD